MSYHIVNDSIFKLVTNLVGGQQVEQQVSNCCRLVENDIALKKR